MLIGLIAQHAQRLQRNFPDAVVTPRKDGAYDVRFTVDAPEVFDRPGIPVLFVAPVGYPSASPAFFWTPDVRFADGATPRHTSRQQAPDGESMRCWPWKPSTWNPNRDSILTFAHQVARVLREAPTRGRDDS